MISGFEDFHFVRPLWLLGLLLVLVVLWMWLRHRRTSSWHDVVDADLLPHLLEGDHLGAGRNWFNILMLTLAWTAAILALAGPAWERIEQQVEVRRDALVVILDLSYSMATQDVPPSRIERARFKLIDLFKQRREGQTAFVVYAGDAHILVPFTDDTNTLTHLLPSLDPSLMPVPGSRVDLALETAQTLFESSQISRGRILLLTDGIDNESRFVDAVPPGHDLVVLGIGTKKGAPIPDTRYPQRGFLKDASGKLVLARLDESHVRAVVRSVGGTYQSLTADQSDLRRLLPDRWWEKAGHTERVQRTHDTFVEQGHWLLLFCLPVLLFLFRRGALASVAALTLPLILPLGLLMGTPATLAQSPSMQAAPTQPAAQPSNVPPPPERSLWDAFWWSGDQQGYRALEDRDPDEALAHLRSPHFRALAYALRQEWNKAGALWGQDESADGHYNRGNAQARQGDFLGALKAYHETLKIEPEMADALHNKALMEQLLAEQNQSQSSTDPSDGEQSEAQDQQQNSAQQGQQGDAEEQQAGGESQQQGIPEAGEEEANQSQISDAQQKQEQEQAQGQGQPQDDEAGQAMTSVGEAADEERIEDEEAYQSLQQWLRRIPDDPGGLLRRKFRYEAEQRARQRGYRRESDEEPIW